MRAVLRVWGLLLGLICVSAQATMLIQVTTSADQDGEDPAHCSLREAVTANALGMDYGGCVYGDTVVLAANTTYVLSRGELQVKGALTLQGYDITTDQTLNNYKTPDPFTGIAPLRAPPSTVITTLVNGQPSSRIAYVASNASLYIQNVVLQGGIAKAEQEADGAIPADGGLIMARGSLSLTNVDASGGSASGNGGAFAIYGPGNGFSMTGGIIHDNSAGGWGGALFFGPLAMQGSAIDANNSCATNGVFDAHATSITSASFYQNDAASGAAGIFFCGDASVNLSNDTFEQNGVGASGVAGTGAALDMIVISSASSFNAENVTITDNDLGIQLLSPISAFTISNSIVFWNHQDCDYSDFSVSPLIAPSGSRYNVFGASCAAAGTRPAWFDLNPQAGATAAASNAVTAGDVAGGAISSGQLSWVSAQIDAPFPMMLPTANATLLLSQGSNSTGGCTSSDQRGVPRRPGTNGKPCDIGAGERKVLYAANDAGSNGTAKPGSGDGRQVQIDILANDEAPEEASLSSLQAWGVTNVQGGCTYDSSKHMLNFDGATLGDFGNTSKTATCHYSLCGNSSCSVTSAPATVNITVSNQAPLAVDDYLYFSGAQPATINVLSNDYDQDGGDNRWNALDPNTVTVVGFPVTGSLFCGTVPMASNGQVTCPGGLITYQATDNYAKFQDQFTYTVADVDGAISNKATVHVNPVDQNTPAQGGGSESLLTLMGLAALLGARQRRQV